MKNMESNEVLFKKLQRSYKKSVPKKVNCCICQINALKKVSL